MLSAALLACVLVQGQPHDVARSPRISVGINFDLSSLLRGQDDCAPRRECRAPVVVERPVCIERPVYVERQVVVQQPVCAPPPVVCERVVYVNAPVVVSRPVYAERCEPRVYVSHPIYAEACERRECRRPVEVQRKVVVEHRDERHDGRRW